MKRENHRRPCYYCRRIMIPYNLLKEGDDEFKASSVEHIVCRSNGGTDDIKNLEIACKRCNQLRGNIPHDVFMEFARVVIRQYPEHPTKVLRSALNQFIYFLAEGGLRNTKSSRGAIRVALLTIADSTF